MAQTPKLDRIDLKILHELQKDGRITNVKLADAVGLSPSPDFSPGSHGCPPAGSEQQRLKRRHEEAAPGALGPVVSVRRC
jgi:AsnC-type helix-turn-helix domain